MTLIRFHFCFNNIKYKATLVLILIALFLTRLTSDEKNVETMFILLLKVQVFFLYEFSSQALDGRRVVVKY